MGKKTKISSFDSSWNPVTGCRHNCVYCYANRIASRFAGYDANEELNRYKYAITGYKGQNIYEVDVPMTRLTKDGEKETAVYPFGFAPTLFNYKLRELKEWKEPKDIFVCSMGDLFGDFIPDSWIKLIFHVCEDNPKHRYFFLTKNPKRYVELFEKGLVPKNHHDNMWFGTTVTAPDMPYFWKGDANCFLSIEPIQERFESVADLFLKVKWVIVGAETGNRLGKVKPEREWIEHIAEGCRKYEIPLFMKDSLQSLMKKNFIQEKP